MDALDALCDTRARATQRARGRCRLAGDARAGRPLAPRLGQARRPGARRGAAGPVSRQRILALLHAGFLLAGAVTVLLGPLVPELRGRRGLESEQVALLFVAQFAASSVGAVLSSRGLRLSVCAGYALAAAGLALLARGAWPQPLAAMALVGLGLGLAIPASNLLVAGLAHERRAAALSTLNLAWGLGAVSCPLLFAALLDRVPAAVGLWLLAALAALACLALAPALARLETFDRAPAPAAAGAGAARALNEGRWAEALVLGALAAELFFYVGTEGTIGGWIVALAGELHGLRAVAPLLIGAAFWAALLAGRALAPLALRRLSEPALHVASLAVAWSGALALLLGATPAWLAFGAVVAGAGLSALFPLVVARLSAQVEARRSRAAGWAFAAAGLGGAALPWLAGRIIARTDSVRAGFLVPLAGLLLMAALFGARRRPAPGSEGARAALLAPGGPAA